LWRAGDLRKLESFCAGPSEGHRTTAYVRKGMSRTLAAIAALLAVAAPEIARAVTLEAQDARISINGFIDLQYTYMGRLPRAAAPPATGLTTQDVISTLDQDRLNLILKVDRDRFRVNVNVSSRNAYATGGVHPHGEFSIMEAYGEYRVSQGLNVRGGSFLVPFGIYNEIRYATSLFAPVVLPQVYETLPNYHASGGAPHVVPEEGNLMVSGARGPGTARVFYAAYVGSGDRNQYGTDRNEDKAVGGRLTLLLDQERQGLGVSYYTTDEGGDVGRRHHIMTSADLRAGRWGLEAEALWLTTTKDRYDVFAYYLRLRRQIGKATPFIGFDYFEDDKNPIYTEGMQRWSTGLGYEATSNLYLKAEYHYHVFDGATIPSDADRVHMVRLAAIMVF
jgi:hypothetical protein